MSGVLMIGWRLVGVLMIGWRLVGFDELQTQGYISIYKTLKNEKYNCNFELFFSHVTFSSQILQTLPNLWVTELHPTPLRGRTCTRPIHFKRAPVSVASLRNFWFPVHFIHYKQLSMPIWYVFFVQNNKVHLFSPSKQNCVERK